MNTVNVKALIKNIKRERPDLAANFSEHALTEIAKNEIVKTVIKYIKIMKQNPNSIETTLKLNIAEFLAEYFTDYTNAKDQFSYGPFWDAVVANNYNGERINIFTGNKQKCDGSFYYEYGLLKAEEEMEAEQLVTEKRICSIDGRKLYSYNIRYENPDEKPVSFYFYTRTRIMAFIQHENEVMNNLAAEMRGNHPAETNSMS